MLLKIQTHIIIITGLAVLSGNEREHLSYFSIPYDCHLSQQSWESRICDLAIELIRVNLRLSEICELPLPRRRTRLEWALRRHIVKLLSSVNKFSGRFE